jgi:hypothetical protein
MLPFSAPLFSILHRYSKPGGSYREQEILGKEATLGVKAGGGNIPTTKLASLQTGIKASIVPQWLWTMDECHAWMYTVLIHYLNVSKFATTNVPTHQISYI